MADPKARLTEGYTTRALRVHLLELKRDLGRQCEPERHCGSISWVLLRRYSRTVMSIQVTYRDGVFRPLEEVAGADPGATYTVFAEEELLEFIETVCWLKAAEQSLEFWDNPADAVCDTL